MSSRLASLILLVALLSVGVTVSAQNDPGTGCTVTPRLQAHARAMVVVNDSGLFLRAAPSVNAPALTEVPNSAVFYVLEGPDCTTEYVFWRIHYMGIEGWLAEGGTGAYFTRFVDEPYPPSTPECLESLEVRLAAGDLAQVLDTPSGNLTIRSAPSMNAPVAGEVPIGAELQITGGGNVCEGHSRFWQVSYQGLTGWAIEGDYNVGYFLKPTGRFALPVSTFTFDYAICPLPPRLIGEAQARTKRIGDTLNLRAHPSPEAEKLGEIAEDTPLTLLQGPVCTPDYVYWLVEGAGQRGWAVEAYRGGYWMEPAAATPSPFSAGGLTLTLEPDIARAVSLSDVQAIVPTDSHFEVWERLPAHRRLDFVTAGVWRGTVWIFPLEQYELYFPGFTPSFTAALAASAPLPPELLATFFQRGEQLALSARWQRLETPAFSGYCFIGKWLSGIFPMTDDFTYAFAGLSADGLYFIRAEFPMQMMQFPATLTLAQLESGIKTAEDSRRFVENYPAYLGEVTVTLEDAAPEAIFPAPQQFDALLASLRLEADPAVD